MLLLAASAANAQVWLPSPPAVATPKDEVVLPIAAMQGRAEPGARDQPNSPGDPAGYTIQLEPPGPDRLFRLESEASLNERIRQEARGRGVSPERITFPEEPVLSTERYSGRSWPKQTAIAEPHYVCHRRLYFEQRNEERFGWDLGFIHPVVSAAYFFGDLATMPYKFGTEPCRWWECSAGLCLPGQPTPYLLYPPQPSVTGIVMEAAIIGTLFAIFP